MGKKPAIPPTRKRELVKALQEVEGGGRTSVETSRVTVRGGDGSAPAVPKVAVDVGIVAVIGLLSVVTRFYRIASPDEVVFDEFHFYNFVSMYRQKLHLFDIHPPLGKLILLFGGVLGNFNPDFDSDAIGKVYPSPEHYVSLRQTSAFFGSMSPPLTYGVARLLGLSQITSATAASMILFDMLNTIESRLVLIDSQVLFFSQLAFFCALILWKQPPKSRSRWAMVVITGIFAGCALATKWTTLATPGIIAIVSFFGCFLPRSRLTILECLTAGASGLLVYAFSFWVHFELSQESSSGDPFLPISFQSTLFGSRYFRKDAVRAGFLELFAYLNKEMLRANASITTRHPWESKWYEWPLDLRGILYYLSTSPEGDEIKMYLIGNPVVFYVCLIGTLVFMGTLLFYLKDIRFENVRAKTGNILDSWRIVVPNAWLGPGVILLATYWLNLLPYILVARAAFLYHFIPGLFYSILVTAVLLDRLPIQIRMVTCAVIMVGTVGCFWYWAPWVYALPLSSDEQKGRELFPRWN